MREDKHSLGRSIADLLEENIIDEATTENIVELDINHILANTDQPRSVFDENALKDLANSIKEHGILQPVIVKPNNANNYMLVAGERRVRAAKLAGLTTVPAIVREYNTKYISVLALMENLQREDLTPIEEAIAFQTVIKKLGITHEELGKRIGKSRVYVTNILGLLHLPASVIESVNHGIITMGHARALSKIKKTDTILQLHEKVIKEELTVRELESLIRNIQNSIGASISDEVLEYSNTSLKGKLPEYIKYKLSKTQLTFRFDSKEELEELLKLIKGVEK